MFFWGGCLSKCFMKDGWGQLGSFMLDMIIFKHLTHQPFKITKGTVYFFYRLSNGFSLKWLAKFNSLRKIVKIVGYTFTISTYACYIARKESFVFINRTSFLASQTKCSRWTSYREAPVAIAIASRNVCKLYLFVFFIQSKFLSIDKHNYFNCLRERGY